MIVSLVCIIAILIIWIIVEYFIGSPDFIFKWITRDFKIALFTCLKDSGNQQLYIIVGITWFNIIITYQKSHSKLVDSSGYSGNFIIGKRRWKKYKTGYKTYYDAKMELDNVRKYYIPEKYNKEIWIGGLLNEDEI